MRFSDALSQNTVPTDSSTPILIMFLIPNAIRSVCYTIHIVFDPYAFWFICYPIHTLSIPYAFQSIKIVTTFEPAFAFIIFNAVFRCPQPKHSPHWLFYSSIKFSVVLSHIQIVFLIMYPIHMLYNPYAIWSIYYLIHMLSDSYSIRSIRYLIYTLSDPYAIQYLRYLIHTLSVPYAIWSIYIRSIRYKMAEVPINLSRKTIKDKFCEAKLFYSFT